MRLRDSDYLPASPRSSARCPSLPGGDLRFKRHVQIVETDADWAQPLSSRTVATSFQKSMRIPAIGRNGNRESVSTEYRPLVVSISVV